MVFSRGARRKKNKIHIKYPCLYRGGKAKQLQIFPNTFEEVATLLRSSETLAADIETYGDKKGDALNPRKGEIRLLSLRTRDGLACTIDLQALGYDLGPLKTVLETATLIFHRARFDVGFLREKCGLNPRNIVCTLTAAQILTNGTRVPNKLDTCLKRYLDIEPGAELGKSDWSGELTEEQLAYAERDTEHLHALWDVLREELVAEQLWPTWELERDLLPIVVDMEHAGFQISVDATREYLAKMEAECEARAQAVYDVLPGPEPINLRSPKQVLPALRSVPGLEELPNTGKDTLARYSDHVPVAKLLDYRHAQEQVKQLTSYLKEVDAQGRIHSEFNPMGAATGRFTSSRPNLQNAGRGPIRNLFAVAGPDRKLVVADFGQVELRVAAVLSGETRMLEAYEAGEDLHGKTAAILLGKPVSEVTAEERQAAKSANFGFTFCQTANGLARQARTQYGLKLSEAKARDIKRKFFAGYPRLSQWHARSRQMAHDEEVNTVRSKLGRRRWLRPADEDHWWSRYTQCANTPIQAAAADGFKMSMVKLAPQLPPDASIVSVIHDEIVVECAADDAEHVAGLVSRSMEEAMGAYIPGVAFTAEAGIGDNWGEAK